MKSFFESLRTENQIRRVLRKLSKQRVRAVLPGNVWLIDNAVPESAESDCALLTCLLRGWVELYDTNVPSRQLPEDLKLPTDKMFNKKSQIYTLSGAGWDAVNRTHLWTVLTLFITFAALFVGLR
jgi:hypothetical protein